MDIVKEWSFLICFASIISASIEFLVPPGKIGRTMNFVLGLFGITVFFMPLGGKYNQFTHFFKRDIFGGIQKPKASYKGSLLGDINEQIISQANKKIEPLIFRNLKNINVYPKKIEIFMDKNDQESIVMIRCKIFVNSENVNLKEQIIDEIENKLNIKTEVIEYAK